ncbi:MAG: hypothetical protein DRI71_07415 [Bacteroidetes bacterium]|nr:MAG: hypothetical protein DRI71_07415 [Bacteroidota bacterium]
MKKENKVILNEFDPGLFWDTKPENIDLQKHVRYIVERVITRGSLADWQRIKRLYGLKKIKELSVQIKTFDRKTICFLSAYFDVPEAKFRRSKFN